MAPNENDVERRFRQVERTLADFYRLSQERELQDTRSILRESKDALRQVKQLYEDDWEDDDLFEQRFSELESTLNELQSHLNNTETAVSGIEVDGLSHRNLLEVVGYYKGSIGSLKHEMRNYKAERDAKE